MIRGDRFIDEMSNIIIMLNSKMMDLMIERLGLIVRNKVGEEVKLLDFIKETEVNTITLGNTNNNGQWEIENL